MRNAQEPNGKPAAAAFDSPQEPSALSRRRHWPRRVLFAVCWICQGALLVSAIPIRPLSGPEAQFVLRSPRDGALAFELAAAEGRPPLAYWLCGQVGAWTGLESESLRWMPALFAFAAMRIAVRLFSRAASLGFVSFCLLFAFSPFWTQLGATLSPDAMSVFLALWSTRLLLAGLRVGRKRTWAAYAFANVLLFYTSAAAWGVALAHWAATARSADARRDSGAWRRAMALALAWPAALLAFAPWLWAERMPLSRDLAELAAAPVDLDSVQRAGFVLGYALYAFMFGDAVAPWIALRAALLSMPFVAAGCFGLERMLGRRQNTLRTLAFCALMFLGLAAAYALKAPLRDGVFDMPGKLAFLFPFFFMAAAYGFGAMRRGLGAPLLLVVLGAQAYGQWSWRSAFEYTNWRRAVPVAEILDAIDLASDHDTLLLVDGVHLPQVALAYDGPLPMLALNATWPASVDSLDATLRRFRRVLLLRAARERALDGGLDLAQAAIERQFALADRIQFMPENPEVAEIKTYLTGEPALEARIALFVFSRRSPGAP
ncbi:MAG: hypothetical protein BWZ10_00746 [candidate division BRC1 bacterium ADurb.BinA364]|nr:MAG: hypothetical protein BWZ10_00746 [candidate division BRC1 bacterium ADurb.BinA364]